MYKDEIKKIEKMSDSKQVTLIRPTFLEISRLESNYDDLKLAYYHGYTKSEEYIEDIKAKFVI